jgi:hypothetical protein
VQGLTLSVRDAVRVNGGLVVAITHERVHRDSTAARWEHGVHESTHVPLAGSNVHTSGTIAITERSSAAAAFRGLRRGADAEIGARDGRREIDVTLLSNVDRTERNERRGSNYSANSNVVSGAQDNKRWQVQP